MISVAAVYDRRINPGLRHRSIISATVIDRRYKKMKTIDGGDRSTRRSPTMRLFRIGLVALFFSAVSICTATEKESYKIDPTHSRIGFKVNQAFANVTGQFRQFGGTVQVDREHPEKSLVTTTIQVKGIDTGIAKRDAHLRSEEFFNAAKFPEITFKSRSVKQTGPEEGDIVGDFTMHGVTRPITLHVKLLNRDNKSTRWQVTTAPLSRREFGVQFSKSLEGVSMISNKVAVDIEIVATAR